MSLEIQNSKGFSLNYIWYNFLNLILFTEGTS